MCPGLVELHWLVDIFKSENFYQKKTVLQFKSDPLTSNQFLKFFKLEILQ